MIFESHAHYDDEEFEADREELLTSLEEHGIGAVINIGASLAGSEMTVKLSEQYSFIYGAVGVHPSEVEELTQVGLARLRSLCGHRKVVAVGEIGLDYHYPEPAVSLQKEWFERQLELARDGEASRHHSFQRGGKGYLGYYEGAPCGGDRRRGALFFLCKGDGAGLFGYGLLFRHWRCDHI